MTRSQITLPDYFDRYINLCDNVTIAQAIETSIKEIEQAPIQKWKDLGLKTYAPDKWTVNELLQHIIDVERIFTYRALAYARGEQQKLPSFDEDNYAKASNANERSLDSIIDELILVHQSTLSLFNSFTNDMLQQSCIGFKGLYSVASVGFILPGHQRWHFKILEERYYALV